MNYNTLPDKHIEPHCPDCKYYPYKRANCVTCQGTGFIGEWQFSKEAYDAIIASRGEKFLDGHILSNWASVSSVTHFLIDTGLVGRPSDDDTAEFKPCTFKKSSTFREEMSVSESPDGMRPSGVISCEKEIIGGYYTLDGEHIGFLVTAYRVYETPIGKLYQWHTI
jgi:hypothetical protein